MCPCGGHSGAGQAAVIEEDAADVSRRGAALCQNTARCTASLAAAAVYEKRPLRERGGGQSLQRQIDAARDMPAAEFTRRAHIYQNRAGCFPAGGNARIGFVMLYFHVEHLAVLKAVQSPGPDQTAAPRLPYLMHRPVCTAHRAGARALPETENRGMINKASARWRRAKQERKRKMKIAVAYESGRVFQHFGHSQAFRVYDVQDGKIITAETVPTQGSGHGALAGFLAARGVDTLICGGIGAGARQALAQAGIRLFPGVQGPADEAVKDLLAGTLAYNPDTVCTHHHGGGHEAGHSCAHGGEEGCRHGSCGA